MGAEELLLSVHRFPLQVHLEQLAADQKSACGSVWFAFVFQCDEAHDLTNARHVLSPRLPLLPLGCLSLWSHCEVFSQRDVTQWVPELLTCFSFRYENLNSAQCQARGNQNSCHTILLLLVITSSCLSTTAIKQKFSKIMAKYS